MADGWTLDDLPPRYRAQAEAQLARRPRRRLPLPVETPAEPRRLTVAPLVLDLALIPWSLNDERSGHWTEHRRRTAAVRDLVALKIPTGAGRYAGQVEILATPRGVRHDTGNTYPTVKAAIDALVDVGILAGDTGRHVARVVLCAPISGPPGLILVVRPA